MPPNFTNFSAAYVAGTYGPKADALNRTRIVYN